MPVPMAALQCHAIAGLESSSLRASGILECGLWPMGPRPRLTAYGMAYIILYANGLGLWPMFYEWPMPMPMA